MSTTVYVYLFVQSFETLLSSLDIRSVAKELLFFHLFIEMILENLSIYVDMCVCVDEFGSLAFSTWMNDARYVIRFGTHWCI